MQKKADQNEIDVANYLELFELQNTIFGMVAEDAGEQAILDELCRLQERLVAGSIASIMRLADDGHSLNVLAAPSLNADAKIELSGLQTGAGNGSCANVIFQQSPQYVRCIEKDERWADAKELAEKYRLKACWSVPVNLDGKVVGTFALSCLSEREPSAFEQTLLSQGARIVSIVLDREKHHKRDVLVSRVFENISEGILVADRANRIIETNDAFTAITGYGDEEILGRNPQFLIAEEEHVPGLSNTIFKALSSHGVWRGEVQIRRADGVLSYEWVTVSLLKDDAGRREGLLYVISDINELKVSQEQLAHLAYHDPLTGLANRPMLEERITHMVMRSEREKRMGALLFLDLDRFKYLNDTFGHATGDRMLVEIGKRLEHAMRKEDTVARFGGDEFVVLLESISDRESVFEKAQTLLQLFQSPFDYDGHNYRIYASIGIAIFPENGADAETLIKHADTAMYQAKKTPEHISFYTPKMSEHTRERLVLEKELHDALEHHELEVYYQPVLKGDDTSLYSAEALVRWNHPSRGLVLPGEFIPFAEETGLISQIDEWVLMQVIADLRRWHSETRNRIVPVSVNISGRHINGQDVTRLIQILNRSALARDYIGLEVTETYLMEFAEETIVQLQRLKHAGIRLSMDDFGSGYSSLGFLKRFKIDTLKIDQLLVADIVTDPEDRSIADAIIKMGHSLGLSIIAEGVESLEQYETLRSFGCDAVQGFYFDKALQCDAFEEKYLRRIG